jgi:hypothetical protein
MASTKISALTALTGATLDSADEFAVVDDSATETKRITAAELAQGLSGEDFNTLTVEKADYPTITLENTGVTAKARLLDGNNTGSAWLTFNADYAGGGILEDDAAVGVVLATLNGTGFTIYTDEATATPAFNAYVQVRVNGDVILGQTAAKGTTDTDGFVYIPSMAGPPTGTPTSYTAAKPMVWDSTNEKMYVYDGSEWRPVGRPETTTKTADYTVAQSDEGNILYGDGTSAAVEFEFPTGLDVGTTITIINIVNTNAITIAAGAGATLTTAGSLLTVSADKAVTVICTAANTWRAFGGLE